MSGEAPGQAARTPGQAVYEAWFGNPAADWNGRLNTFQQAGWERIAQAGIAAYVEANGDPVDVRAVIAEATGLTAVEVSRGAAPGSPQHLRAQLGIAQSALRDIAMGGVVVDGKLQPIRDPSVHADKALVSIAASEAPAAERPAGEPSPELAAAMAEARQLRDYLDDFTRAVIDLDAGRGGNFAKAAHSVRKKTGLSPVEGK